MSKVGGIPLQLANFTMSTIRKVVVAGATGSVGRPVTRALIDAGFEVTALSRSSQADVSGASVLKVDYNSAESLTQALRGQDALVSTLNPHKPGEFDLLFNTAIAEGVKKLVPSEFGSDTLSAESRALPVFASKVALQDHLKSKVVGTASTYTLILNNAFLDWGLEHDFIIDRSTKTAQLCDGGDVKFTMTPLSLVAAAVVGVLKHPDETANKAVKIHGIAASTKHLIEVYQKYSPGEWQTTPYDTKAGVKSAYQSLQSNPGDIFAWILPMLRHVAMGKGSDNDWTKTNDNALLGIKPLTEDQFEQYVKAAVI